MSRNAQEHRHKIMELIRQAAYKHAVWRIWDDLMFFGAAALSQPLKWVQAREDEYLKRIGQYDKNTQKLFAQMFAEIVLAFEQEGRSDILGKMYMELELSSHWKGQFFTPDTVCRAMAEILFSDTVELIEKKGFITVNDPACGGGAMLIAFANACEKNSVNYQHDVLFIGQDIDPVVARMCHISMSLLGMPGYVIIGDTLRMESREVLYTPLYFVSGFQWRRQREDISEVQTVAVDLQQMNKMKQVQLVF